MKFQYLILLLPLSIFLSGCASTEYKPYEGRNIVYEGQGGTRTTIDGIDFWEYGDPPRKFTIMGVIEDERPGGYVPMAHLRDDIAQTAKAQGADAVLLLSSGSQFRGAITNTSAQTRFYGNTAFTTGSAVSMPVFRNNAQFLVIKYLE